MAISSTHPELYRPFNGKLGQRSADAKPIFEWDPNSILYTGPEKRDAQQLSPNVRLDGDDVIAWGIRMPNRKFTLDRPGFGPV